jgi:hypothetical protein
MIGNMIRIFFLGFLAAGAFLVYTLATQGFDAFFQWLGIFFAAGILLLITMRILLFLLMRFIGKNLLQALGGTTKTPDRITLVKTDDLEFSDEATIQKSVSHFQQLGFQDVGKFEIPEMTGVKLQAFCHEKHAVYGVIYEHERAGIWTDLVCRVKNGDSWHKLTYNNSTSKLMGTMDKPPGSVSVKDAGAPIAKLLQRLIAERPQGELWSISAAQFTGFFEQAYADEMAWRKSRGGPTEQEIKRVANATGREFTDEQVQTVRDRMAKR